MQPVPMEIEQIAEPAERTDMEKLVEKWRAKWARDAAEWERLHALKPAQEQFYYAVERGHFDKVEAFLESGGVDVNCMYKKRYSPIQQASMHGDLKVLELLLENGADVHSVCETGHTALHLALISANHRRFEEIVLALLLHGSDVNVRGRRGRTAIHIAVQYSSTAIVNILLNHGADISKRDDENCNALHMASIRSRGSVHVQNKICRILLNHGSDVFFKLQILRTYDNGVVDDDNSDSDDDIPAFTPAGIAELMNKPIMAEMMEIAEMQCVDKLKAVESAKLAVEESDRRAKKTAFAMGHHVRLGADSPGIVALAPDVLQMILAYV